MIDHLPDRLDLLATADAGRVLRGRIKLASMQRLLTALTSSDGDFQVYLELGKDPDGTRYMRGTIQGAVGLQCQRCLEPMSLPLDIGFRLGIIREQQALNALPERYEPLLVGAEPMCLADIVSDEVLLALPLVPAHADSEKCHEFVRDYKPSQPDKRDGPFAVLAELQQKP
jgi:uncharacterized protein